MLWGPGHFNVVSIRNAEFLEYLNWRTNTGHGNRACGVTKIQSSNCGAGLKKAISRHADHGQAADYDHTNQEGKDKAAAALLGIEVPAEAKKSSTGLPHSSSNSESSSSSSSSSSIVPHRKRRNNDERRRQRKRSKSKSRNRSSPESRASVSSPGSSCQYDNERRPHSRRQVEELHQHHHSNRHFQTSAPPQVLDQQQSHSLSPVPNSKCLYVIHVCLFLTLFISFCSHF